MNEQPLVQTASRDKFRANSKSKYMSSNYLKQQALALQ